MLVVFLYLFSLALIIYFIVKDNYLTLAAIALDIPVDSIPISTIPVEGSVAALRVACLTKFTASWTSFSLTV